MRSLIFPSCLPVLERSSDVNSKFTDPLCGCKGSAYAAAGEGQHCLATSSHRCERSRAVSPRSPHHTVLAFHSSLTWAIPRAITAPTPFGTPLGAVAVAFSDPWALPGASKAAPASELLFLVIWAGVSCPGRGSREVYKSCMDLEIL